MASTRVMLFMSLLVSLQTFAQTTVGVMPATNGIALGDSVTLSVVVDSVTSLFAAHTRITFDNAIIQSIAIVKGSLLGEQAFFSISPTPSPTTSSIGIDQAMLVLGGVSGSGVLFTISYIASGAGTSPVVLSDVSLRNASNQSIPATVHMGSVSVTLSTVTVQYPVFTQWNLLSVPLNLIDPRTSSVFPTATSNAYSFDKNRGYVSSDTLRNGMGYWLKFPTTQNVTITGTVRLFDTVEVLAGWNLVGSISCPVATSSMVQIPAGIVASSYYGYNGVYMSADTLQPSKGYWVKVNQNGKLVLR